MCDMMYACMKYNLCIMRDMTRSWWISDMTRSWRISDMTRSRRISDMTRMTHADA